MSKDKNKKQLPETNIVCIYCYAPLSVQEAKRHPCTQPDFPDTIKYAKMIHPSSAHPDWTTDDDYPPWSDADHYPPW